RSAISSASSGAPGTGYSTSNNSCGNPKKSWIVRGDRIAVTAVALMNQWAEIARIARGVGTDRPNAAQACVYRFDSSALSGLPWPTNATGMRDDTPPPPGCRASVVEPGLQPGRQVVEHAILLRLVEHLVVQPVVQLQRQVLRTRTIGDELRPGRIGESVGGS